MEEGYEAQIAKLIDRQKKQVRELKRVQNDNGSKAEQIARINEKIKNLDAELADRKKECADLEEKVKQQKEKSRGLVERITLANYNFNSDIDDAKIVEKFTSLLSELCKDIQKNYDLNNKIEEEELIMPNEKFSKLAPISRLIKQKIDKEKERDQGEDSYAKSSLTAIGVKRLLEKEILSAATEGAANQDDGDEDEETTTLKGFLTTFRISNKTTFAELHEEACRFWDITQVNDYEFTDEKMNKISAPKQKIDSYFKNSGQVYGQYLLYLRKVVPEQNNNSKSATKIEIQADKDKGEEDTKRKESDTFQKFFNQFSGLKAYLEVDKDKTQERVKEMNSKKDSISKINDNHCFVWTTILLLFIFTIVPLSGERSIVTLYYTISGFDHAYGVSTDTFTIPSTNSTFQGIYRQTQFYQFLNNTLATAIFFSNPSQTSDAQGLILTGNTLIGGVRMRQMRVQNRNCSSIPQTIQDEIPCYYLKYSTAVRDTSQINLTDFQTNLIRTWQNDWTTWQDTTTLGVTVGIVGELANYDGSGYTVDIPWGTSVADVQAFAYYLEQNNYIASNTRAIVISFTHYNEAGQFFIYNEMVIEYTPIGILYPTSLNIIPFRTSFFSSAAGRPNHETYDALRVICAVALNIFLLYRVICSEGRIDLKYLLKFQGTLNVFIVLLCYVSVGLNNTLDKDSGAQYSLDYYLTTLEYVEMKQIALGYEAAITVMGVICGLAITRLATLLTMNSRFYLIITSLEEARKQIIFYCMVLVPILFAFSVVAMSIFGLQVEGFSNISNAFISMLMFGLGQVNGQIFIGSSVSALAVVLFTIFYFFATFFLVTVFAGIYIDNYRMTAMDYGYNFIEKEVWSYEELVRWLLPKFVFNQLKKWLEVIKKRIFKNKNQNGEPDNKKKVNEGKKSKAQKDEKNQEKNKDESV